MADAGSFSITFWGVRGSIACPGPDTVRVGGNTPCCEVRCGDHLFILDAGTGLRPLGNHLARTGDSAADLLLTHSHLDHVSGLPFFPFAFDERNQCRIWSGHLGGDQRLEHVLRRMMSPPLFPVPLEVFKAEIAFEHFAAGETLTPAPGIRVRTAPLNHPDNATGYRIEYDGKAICYVTDTCHVPGQPDENVLALIDGADIVVYDSMFTDEEFPSFAHWGHSTWQEAIRLCRAAGAGALALFHHLPGRDDAALEEIEKQAADAFPGAILAREGATLAP